MVNDPAASFSSSWVRSYSPGEPPSLTVLGGEVIGLLAAIDLPPFVKAAGGNDTALGLDEAAEHWFLVQCLGPGIDRRHAGFTIRSPPARDQPPLHGQCCPLAGGVLDDHRQELSGAALYVVHSGKRSAGIWRSWKRSESSVVPSITYRPHMLACSFPTLVPPKYSTNVLT